jgi:hypothetical protein
MVRRIKQRAALGAVLALLAGEPIGVAAADPKPADPVAQAIALYSSGRIAEAKHAFDIYLVDHPRDPRSLYFAATINTTNGQPVIAIQQVLLLLQAAPGSLAALELEVQVYQALGDRQRRDEAIDTLRSERDNTIKPDPRYALMFIRDRFKVNGRTFIGAERFEKGGETIIRYTFAEESIAANPAHILALISDPETNQRWRELAELPEKALVYHLDADDLQPDGSHRHTTYANYIAEPAYDTVRDLAIDILSGRARPLAGHPDPYWTAISDHAASH